MKHELLYEVFFDEVESIVRQENPEWNRLSDRAQGQMVQARLRAIVMEIARTMNQRVLSHKTLEN